MKTKLFGVLTAAAALLGSQQSQALTLEVAPLQLKVRAEVLGVQAGVNGQNAIIFAGNTARKIAQGAGIAFNASTQMIVATGKEVNELILDSARLAGTVGKQGFIITKGLTEGAIDLVRGALQQGTKIAMGTGRFVYDTTRYAVQTMLSLSKKSVVLVMDTGVQVLKTGAAIINGSVNFIKDVIDLILPF